VADIKSDLLKSQEAARAAAQAVEQQVQKPANWVERHPLLVAYGGMALILALVILTVHAFRAH
jgi:hypothetical protein